MQKSESNLKLGVILFIITALAGLFLGGVYQITKEPIAKQKIKKNNEAMIAVLPDADNFAVKEIELPEGTLVTEVNEGKKGDEVQGYAIKLQNEGYGGTIDLMVGISKDGVITGMTILSHTETPGLGANATKDEFKDQYKGISTEKALEVVKTEASADNQIQALTGATITSNFVTGAVNSAVDLYNNELKGGN
ncbi:RnfABCDGE type electron transport complex subunit G [Clostridium sediminicola]|uniref:RnfABCDGE type electron transport complex subunit G n=1 Tax=Clostridium sediminicola TaxID=3114879 RepID=UPI0031F1D7F8